MRHILSVGGFVLIAASVALAQPPEPPRPPMGPGFGPPGLEVVGLGGPDFGEPVEGLPFRAEAVTETVQVFPDGNRIERRTTSTLARDGRGRVRREQPLPPLGPMGPAPDVTIVTITDPVARVQYMLDLDRKTARQMTFPGPGRGPGGPRPGSGRPLPPPPRADRPQVRTESLGTKSVNGLEAEGTRTTMTIPAGAFGNANPIDVVTERWYSPELRLVVASHRSDPIMGDVDFTIADLVRGEPPGDMFEVPSDFTITQMKRPFQQD